MSFARLTVSSALMLFCCYGFALAQRPGPQFWRRPACEPFEPRTKLETFDIKHATVLLKGFTRITVPEVRDVRVDALEMRDLSNASRATGLVVAVRASDEQAHEERAFVDYEEIDSLINGIDGVAGANETMTKLAGFEARYRTRGDLEIGVFRQTRTAIAVTLTIGICDAITVPLTLDDLAKLRAMILGAKARLDEIKVAG
jgi:hypothetical protein